MAGASFSKRVEYERTNFESLRGTREKALKLGLDLLGGMHVTLEVRVDALIRQLAADTDAQFDEVVSAARDAAVSGEVSMIDAFVSEFERRDSDARLSRYFRNEAAGISRRRKRGRARSIHRPGNSGCSYTSRRCRST